MRTIEVYLAGGTRSGWQDLVMDACPQHNFIDPRSHGLKEEAEYTAWDLRGVRECDVVFAFQEKTNPGGQGMCFEAGYGVALGKALILVNEKSEVERWLGMLRASSIYHTENLVEGVDFLARLRPRDLVERRA